MSTQHDNNAGRRQSGDENVLSAMDRHYRKPLAARLRLGPLILAVVLIGLSGYLFKTFATHPTLVVERDRIRIAAAAFATFRDYIPVTGRVVPSNTVYVDAVEGGQVIEVFVEEGEVVYAGQPLVGLKNTNLQLEVIGREAQLTEQINNLSMAQLAFEQTRLKNERDLIQIDYRMDQLTRDLRRHRALAQTAYSTDAGHSFHVMAVSHST